LMACCDCEAKFSDNLHFYLPLSPNFIFNTTGITGVAGTACHFVVPEFIS